MYDQQEQTNDYSVDEALQILNIDLDSFLIALINAGYEDAETWERVPVEIVEQLQGATPKNGYVLPEDVNAKGEMVNVDRNPSPARVQEVQESFRASFDQMQLAVMQIAAVRGDRLAQVAHTVEQRAYAQRTEQLESQHLQSALQEVQQFVGQTVDQVATDFGLPPVKGTTVKKTLVMFTSFYESYSRNNGNG